MADPMLAAMRDVTIPSTGAGLAYRFAEYEYDGALNEKVRRRSGGMEVGRSRSGGSILGHRPLDADGIEIPMLASARGGEGMMILKGSKPLRTATREEWGEYPTLGCWGYDFITRVAKHHFVDNVDVG